MERAAFLTVLILSYFGAGVAAYTGALHTILMRQKHERRHAFYVMARFGYALVVGTIAYAITPVGEITIDGRTWMYLLGLTLSTVGYVGIAFWDVQLKVDAEPGLRSVATQLAAIIERIDDTDARLVIEEGRNTIIEVRAKEADARAAVAKKRADVAESRADEAHDRADEHGLSRSDEHDDKRQARE